MRASELSAGVRAGDRSALARAITLVESTLAEHRVDAAALLEELLGDTGSAQRVGISGVPGVGKSTFVEALGLHLTGAGHRVAVLAVDPTSARTGGSILGDKTRMPKLSADEAAFVRPTPTGGQLGGVHRSSREVALLCEAAGYDVVLVETVGVGQSETTVAQMVDCFLVLMLAGAGDELQGIKKGILELADIVAVNKADADPQAAQSAVADYRRALSLTAPLTPAWSSPVLSCSALTGDGIAEVWGQVTAHRAATEASGDREERRREQRVRWMHELLDDALRQRFLSNPAIATQLASLEADVRASLTTPPTAIAALLSSLAR